MPVTLADLQIVPFDPAKHDVTAFDCGDSDLNDFLKNDAGRYQQERLSHTQLAFLDGELVAYITLLTDSIILKTSEKKRTLRQLLDRHQTIYTFPALKIGRIGVQARQKGNHIGTELLKYAVGLVVRLNGESKIGCRFITLDAYSKSISWYESRGFVFNKHYKHPEKTHPSMRYDILKSPEIA